jgi:hypothetical protein
LWEGGLRFSNLFAEGAGVELFQSQIEIDLFRSLPRLTIRIFWTLTSLQGELCQVYGGGHNTIKDSDFLQDLGDIPQLIDNPLTID